MLPNLLDATHTKMSTQHFLNFVTSLSPPFQEIFEKFYIAWMIQVFPPCSDA